MEIKTKKRPGLDHILKNNCSSVQQKARGCSKENTRSKAKTRL